MKKIVIHKPGGYDKLVLENHPDPEPGPGEVRVKIAAAGVNYADIAIRWGLYESAKKYVGWPITPGFEYAGTIEKTGEGVNEWKVGDEVVGVSFFGAYSDQRVVPVHQVFPMPKGWTFEQAAGVPAVFLTAYHALFQHIVLRKDAIILVHSAAGGVGTALCQLAKIHGCTVVGVVGSSHKVKTAQAFGADHVIDKSTQNLWAEARKYAPEGYDVVLDANGYQTVKQSFEHLRSTGKLIVYGSHTLLPRKGGVLTPWAWAKIVYGYLRTPKFHPTKLPTVNKSIVAFNLSFLFDRRDLLDEAMSAILRWIEEGKIKPPTVTTFSLEDVAKAHIAIESGQTVGKLVLIP